MSNSLNHAHPRTATGGVMKKWKSDQWNNFPPIEDGSFYYSGLVPDKSREVVAIVQILTDLSNNERKGVLFIPPYWRGDSGQKVCVHVDKLSKWPGQWSGPELGLCSVVFP